MAQRIAVARKYADQSNHVVWQPKASGCAYAFINIDTEGNALYTENSAKDVLLFAKALFSNQLARIAPKLYVNLTHQTGRGEEGGDAKEVADYFIRCFHDYGEQLGLGEAEFSEYLAGKCILEYGPGDVLGVALLIYAHGARSVSCVDQFPLSSMSDKNVGIYAQILKSLDGACRKRADSAFLEIGNPASGFNPAAVSYTVTKNGLIGAKGEFDLIISRAVLEHVSNLEDTMRDIQQGMKTDGIAIHQVDLRSHGLDRYKTFDFMTWPTAIYKLMYSHKGFPNRWRVDKYRELAKRTNLRLSRLTPTDRVPVEDLKIIYSKLAREFGQVALDDLAWMGFWMVLDSRSSSEE